MKRREMIRGFWVGGACGIHVYYSVILCTVYDSTFKSAIITFQFTIRIIQPYRSQCSGYRIWYYPTGPLRLRKAFCV